MKIVRVKGGLGNQLFQYAFAKLLAQQTGEAVKIDMTAYEHLLNDPVRMPRILKFNTALDTATDGDLRGICRIPHTQPFTSTLYRLGVALEAAINPKYYFERDRGYRDPESLLKYGYYDGYWQSWRYVEKVMAAIRADFVPSMPLHDRTYRTMDAMERENSVFLGIRKGDYLASEKARRHFGELGQAYYEKAMKLVAGAVENPVFYVFSNDMDWVHKNISLSGYNVIYREKDDQVDDFEEFMLMTACRHAIISNSTFHWWGAALNDRDGKIVVAPENWFADGSEIDIIPPNWKTVPFGG